jgi:hypothetical protein
MNHSPDAMRYLVWLGVVALGAMLAIVDRRVIGRWLFGILLVAGIAGGLAMTSLSPFNFAGTSYYMEGVIVAGGAGLALAGYVVGQLIQILAAGSRGRK